MTAWQRTSNYSGGGATTASPPTANNNQLMLGGELSFFTPRYSFPARNKKRSLWDTTQNTKTSQTQKKQAKVCGQTKIANVALSLSQDEATSTLMHPMAYTIAQHCSGIHRNAFIQTFLSLLGRSEQSGLAQKANPT
jgi:hypothetical protein